MVVMASFFQIQSDYFVEFFAPKLGKHGYQAPYKRKTNEVGDEFLCIMKVGSEILHVISPFILFHICRFRLVIVVMEQDAKINCDCVQVEFNKASQSLTDAVVSSVQKKTALNQLVKVV